VIPRCSDARDVDIIELPRRDKGGCDKSCVT
jgi:hypothetical protein